MKDKMSFMRNSILLMTANTINTGVGFVFSILVAKMFSEYDVGLAGTLLSAAAFLYTISILSFDEVIVNFYNKIKDKSAFINTCLNITLILSILFSLVFLLFIGKISAELSFISGSAWLILAFMTLPISGTLDPLLSHVFIARKSTQVNVIRSVTFNIVRLVSLFFVIPLGAMGIYLSWSMGHLAGLVPLMIFLSVPYIPMIDFGIVKRVWTYGFSIFISKALVQVPRAVSPLIITIILNPVQTAYFYIPLRFVEIMRFIPYSISKSFFAETASTKKFSYKIPLLLMGIIMVPMLVLIFIFGRFILSIYGSNYMINSYWTLVLLAVASLIAGVNEIFSTGLKVLHKTGLLIKILIVPVILNVVLSIYLVQSIGFIGVAVSWVIQELMILTIFIISNKYILVFLRSNANN